ncbi:MAG: porin [Proteobacteria bacterium]|nr:porin [Pseudomonadota bacterium]
MKICSLYGAGFYYIPGTDTCIKIGGYMRAEVDFNASGSFTPNFADHDARTYNTNHWRTRIATTWDVRSQTAYGTLRASAMIAATDDNSAGGGYAGSSNPSNAAGATPYNRLYNQWAFIQWAGFTAGKTASFFDFDNDSYSNQTNVWGSVYAGSGVEVFGYTAQLGNGLSASIAAENNNGHRLGIATTLGVAEGVKNADTQLNAGGGQSMPDIVGNLRIDQAWGSAQIMGAAHQVNFGVASDPSDKVGYALGAGVKVNLPMLGKGDYIVTQFTYGKGAIDYVGSGVAQGNTTKQGGITSYGPGWDAVLTGTGATADLTEGWSITGGFEHFWVPNLKSSLYGAYGKLRYSAAASASLQLAAAGTDVGSSANWSYWQLGSRTVWTPVANLDLSIEVMYNSQQTAFSGASIGDNNWWSGIFRAQRNFYP